MESFENPAYSTRKGGGAYLQAELKEIREGTKMNSRFRSSETVERAILDEKEFQYLYDDNNNFILYSWINKLMNK